MLDNVILVDETDYPIGVMDKYEAHRNGAQLHRAVSVYLFAQVDGEMKLLIQKRSAQKIVGAGMWANTICGNVRPGESYRECAYRRLREELGFKSTVVDTFDLQAVYKFSYFVKCNEEFSEREIDQVFVGFMELADDEKLQQCLENDLKINTAEVAQIDWISFLKLHTFAKKNDWKPDQDHFLPENSEAQVAPWFVYMLRDQELVHTISQKVQEVEEVQNYV